MAIKVVVGRPGEGKTVYLVSWIEYGLTHEYYVCSNIDVEKPVKYAHMYKRFYSMDELARLDLKQILKGNPKCKGILVIMDEVQVYLNSRNWDKLPIEFQLLLQQHRKRGMTIIGATQSIKRADGIFRELVQDFYKIKRIFVWPYFGLSFGVFVLRAYDPDSIESQTGSHTPISWPWLFLPGKRTFHLYDTTQMYEPEKIEGRRELVQIVYRPKTVYEKVELTRDLQPAGHDAR